MDYSELNEEQRRQLVDVQQLFEAWWPADLDLETGPRLYWNKSKGRRYLYEQRQGERRSLGRETSDLARQKAENDRHMKSLRARVRSLKARAEEMAPVNKALGIARMPEIASKIIRELDREAEEPVPVVDLVNDKSRLEYYHVRDHRIVRRIGIFGDVEISLDDAPHVGEEGPVGPHAAAILVRLGHVVGANRDQPAITHL